MTLVFNSRTRWWQAPVSLFTIFCGSHLDLRLFSVNACVYGSTSSLLIDAGAPIATELVGVTQELSDHLRPMTIATATPPFHLLSPRIIFLFPPPFIFVLSFLLLLPPVFSLTSLPLFPPPLSPSPSLLLPPLLPSFLAFALNGIYGRL